MATTDYYSLSHDEAGRVAWNGCFKPSKNDRGDDVYNVKLLFSKTSPAVAKIKAMAAKCKLDSFGANPSFKVENPLHDGDVKYAEDPEKYAAYKGMVEINITTYNKPGVFAPDTSEINATNQHLFPNGCWAVARFKAQSYEYRKDGKGPVLKRGVSFRLAAVQVIRDAGPNEPVISSGGGIQTAEQAGFTPAAANDPANYAPPAAAAGDESW